MPFSSPVPAGAHSIASLVPGAPSPRTSQDDSLTTMAFMETAYSSCSFLLFSLVPTRFDLLHLVLKKAKWVTSVSAESIRSRPQGRLPVADRTASARVEGSRGCWSDRHVVLVSSFPFPLRVSSIRRHLKLSVADYSWILWRVDPTFNFLSQGRREPHYIVKPLT